MPAEKVVFHLSGCEFRQGDASTPGARFATLPPPSTRQPSGQPVYVHQGDANNTPQCERQRCMHDQVTAADQQQLPARAMKRQPRTLDK